MFVRIDSTRKGLQPPYEGPFRVEKRTRKTFFVNRNGKLENISIDRVKPAYLLDSSSDNPVISAAKKSALKKPVPSATKKTHSVSFDLPRPH